MERREPLSGNAIIWQDDALGCFTADAITLCHFMRLKREERCVDLGTGNGVIALYAQLLYGADFTGVDRNEAQLLLARRSAAENGQAACFVHADVSDAPTLLGRGRFDAAVMNPPYYKAGTNAASAARIEARHDAGDTLDRFLFAAFQLLNNGGRLYLCYPAAALETLFKALDKARFSVKRMELRLSKGKARLALIEAKKLGHAGLTITVMTES